jgi:erythrin-vacuolar iron transport family protein
MRSFNSLNEQEMLALAIALEEEDARIYDDFADALKDTNPAPAQQFRDLRAQEDGHRHRLLDLYRRKFGEHIPLIRRQDVKGFVRRKPIWLVRPLGLDAARKYASLMELETKRFYEASALRATDASIRQLLGDLAEEERKHELLTESLNVPEAEEEAAAQRRLFVLQVIQPGLAGLMDGSVSTLAPLFAAAFAPGSNHLQTFRIGLAAGVGAGISMGFAEALSDDGSMTGRGRPWVRGVVCGLMTALGGLGHTLPYLIPHMQTATTIAIGIAFVELLIIAWIRQRYMESSLSAAIVQVVIGGLLVFLAGVLIGTG